VKKKYINFTYKDLRIIGIGTIILNFFVQKIINVNKSLKFMLHYTSRVNCPHGIEIEDSLESNSVYKCFASSNACYINALNGIKISKKVMFASGVKLISANHDIVDRNKHIKDKPIVLEENVWLGANVVILPGITVGKNSIVGAGSIVTKDIPSNSIAVGNPAKVAKEIN